MKRFLLNEKIVYVYTEANGNVLFTENKHAGNTPLKQMTVDKFYSSVQPVTKKSQQPRKITVDGFLPKKTTLKTTSEPISEPIPVPELIPIPEHTLIPDPQPISEPILVPLPQPTPVTQPILSPNDPYEGYL